MVLVSLSFLYPTDKSDNGIRNKLHWVPHWRMVMKEKFVTVEALTIDACQLRQWPEIVIIHIESVPHYQSDFNE
jgi:hypothetical protein